jgi:predicted transcriptional regulator
MRRRVGKKTEPDTRKAERDLTGDELKILRLVANSNGLHPYEAAQVVPLHQQRIQHIMESLQEEGLLDTFLNDMGSHSWHLTKGGRAFLVKMNLL